MPEMGVTVRVRILRQANERIIMTLFEDLKEWYSEEQYPPSGEDINAKRVSYEVVGPRRWGQDFHIVSIYECEPYTVEITKYRRKS